MTQEKSYKIVLTITLIAVALLVYALYLGTKSNFKIALPIQTLSENESIINDGQLMSAMTYTSNDGEELIHTRLIVNSNIVKDNDNAVYFYSSKGKLIGKQYYRDDGAYVTEVSVE